MDEPVVSSISFGPILVARWGEHTTLFLSTIHKKAFAPIAEFLIASCTVLRHGGIVERKLVLRIGIYRFLLAIVRGSSNSRTPGRGAEVLNSEAQHNAHKHRRCTR